ncbi:TetR/AcrR family transcriptional regulator [Microbacterium sp. AG238]|uniref:TetR/AcrR family transcriptional regulator n=1 Tax=Microbacterium sp. AG238 TaxID=2183994 RepID=UPI000E75AF77|nr:TetR family transcriptional regulator [Microbacterium sp. AG238]
MDPRSMRSREALRRAALDLAAVRPLTDLSVSEICRTAGVTRDTFYRHADAPVSLVADALSVELADVLSDVGELDSLSTAEGLLLQHVKQRADVYRGALHPSLAAPIRAVLERVIAAGLEEWLARHPEIEPPAIDDLPSREIAVAYAAGGTVAAIEAWLRSGADDVAWATRAILAASPEWWLR